VRKVAFVDSPCIEECRNGDRILVVRESAFDAPSKWSTSLKFYVNSIFSQVYQLIAVIRPSRFSPIRPDRIVEVNHPRLI
jgi:hypothetical protein